MALLVKRSRATRNNFGSTAKRPTHPRCSIVGSVVDGRVVVDQGLQSQDHDPRRLTAVRRFTRMRKQLANRSGAIQLRGVSATAGSVRRKIRDAMLVVHGRNESDTRRDSLPPIINRKRFACKPRQVNGHVCVCVGRESVVQPTQPPFAITVLRLRGLVAPLFWERFKYAIKPDFSCEQREASTVTPASSCQSFNGQTTATTRSASRWRACE